MRRKLFTRHVDRHIRRSLGGLALGLAAAASVFVVSPAHASDQFVQTYDLRYVDGAAQPAQPGRASGLDALMTADDPGEPFSFPRRASRIEIRFAPGTRFHRRGVPNCELADLQASGPAGCPAGSRVGTGHAKVRTGLAPPGTPFGEFDEDVQIFDSADGMLFDFHGERFRVDLGATLRGRTLELTIPPAPLALSSLALDVPPRVGDGRHPRPYVTAPPACPHGAWTTRATFGYTDGTSLTKTAASPCGRRR